MHIWPYQTKEFNIRQYNNHFPMPLNILQTIINTQNINSHLFWDNLIKMHGQFSKISFSPGKYQCFG